MIKPTRQRGFTIMEMVVSIMLISIMSGMMAVFLRVPMESHFVTRQRLTLTDESELAVRHMDQELRQALPNSVRIFPAGVAAAGAVKYIEFLAVRTDGRYRATASANPSAALGGCPAAANELTLGGDTCFTTLGPVMNGAQIISGQDYVVINNASSAPVSTTSAYTNGNGNSANKARVTYSPAVAAAPLPHEDRIQFPNLNITVNPISQRFYIVTSAVTYECNPGLGQIRRYSGYGIVAVQPTPPAVAPSIIVQDVTACQINYDVPAGGTLGGMVTVSLTLSRNTTGNASTETANLFMQIPVNTWP